VRGASDSHFSLRGARRFFSRMSHLGHDEEGTLVLPLDRKAGERAAKSFK
jgi:hypothetical protein